MDIIISQFPVLSTPRLILRALTLSDLDDLYEYASDPEIDRYTPWDRYKSLDEAQKDLVDYIAHYEQGRFHVWGIEHRADKKLIGITNFGHFAKPDRRAEIGYTIARKYWRHGFATEAAQAMIHYGFEQLDLARIEAVVLPENVASARVLEKAGMQYEGLLRNYQVWKDKPSDLQMYSIIRRT